MSGSAGWKTMRFGALAVVGSFVWLTAATARAQPPEVPPPAQRADAPEFPPSPPYEEAVAQQRPLWRVTVGDIVDRAFHSNLDLHDRALQPAPGAPASSGHTWLLRSAGQPDQQCGHSDQSADSACRRQPHPVRNREHVRLFAEREAELSWRRHGHRGGDEHAEPDEQRRHRRSIQRLRQASRRRLRSRCSGACSRRPSIAR